MPLPIPDVIEPHDDMTFLHWLALLFIALRLTNHIEWNWFYVLLPLFGQGLLVLLAVVFQGVHTMFIQGIEKVLMKIRGLA